MAEKEPAPQPAMINGFPVAKIRPFITAVFLLGVTMMCAVSVAWEKGHDSSYREYQTSRLMHLNAVFAAEMDTTSTKIWVPDTSAVPNTSGGWNISNVTWTLLQCNPVEPSEMCACLLDNTLKNNTHNSSEIKDCLLDYMPTMIISDKFTSLKPYYLIWPAILIALLGRGFCDWISTDKDITSANHRTYAILVFVFGVLAFLIAVISACVGGTTLIDGQTHSNFHWFIFVPIGLFVLLMTAVMTQHNWIASQQGGNLENLQFNMLVTVSIVKKVFVVVMVSVAVCIMRGWGDALQSAVVAILLTAVCIVDMLGQILFLVHADPSNVDEKANNALESVRMFSWFLNFFVVVSLWVMNFPQYGDEIAHSSIGFTILLIYIAVSTLGSDFANEYRVMSAFDIVNFRLQIDDLFVVVIGLFWIMHFIQINQ